MSKTFNFSLLANDVNLDDCGKYKNPSKVPATQNDSSKKPSVPIKAKPSQKVVKKKQQQQSLQALAFGNGKNKKKNNTATPKSSGNDNKKGSGNSAIPSNGQIPSEDWITHDKEYIESNYEKDTRAAILMSKLEYEANKSIYEKAREEEEKNKSKMKKKKSTVTLSLAEFNSRDSPKLLKENGSEPKHKWENSKDVNFFKEFDKQCEMSLLLEARSAQYKELKSKEKGSKMNETNKYEPSANKIGMVSVTEVEKRDFEIQALRLEVADLKDQLETTKLRNRKLCEVLAEAEMRSKSEIVLELQKVAKSRDEFSAEVANLSEQLEQEKTKVSQLQGKVRKK